MFQIIHCWFSNWNCAFAGVGCVVSVSNHTLLVQQLKLWADVFRPQRGTVSNHTLLVQQLKPVMPIRVKPWIEVSNHTLLVQQLKLRGLWPSESFFQFQIIHCWFSNWNEIGAGGKLLTQSFKSYIAGSATETNFCSLSCSYNRFQIIHCWFSNWNLKLGGCRLKVQQFQIIHCWFSNWNLYVYRRTEGEKFQIIHCWFSNWNVVGSFRSKRRQHCFKSYIAGSATETILASGEMLKSEKVSNHTLLVQQLKQEWAF